MKRYVLDANAVVTLIENRAGAEKVERLISAADGREAEVFASSINLGEAFYTLWRYHGEAATRQRLQEFLGSPVIVVDAGLNRCIQAAEIKAKYRSGYGDSFLAELAFEKNATVVTADPDFKRFGDKLKVLWLPSHKSIN